MKKLSFLVLLLAMPCIGLAATGDVLFNCTFDGSGTTPAQIVANCGGTSGGLSSGKIVSGGHNGGKAISFYYPNTGQEVFDPFWTPKFNKQELTVEYYEKFDVDPKSSGIWNVKSIRQYVGPGGSDYMAAIMSLHNGGGWYQSAWTSAQLTTTSSVSNVVVDPYAYCSGNGFDYNCSNGRMELSWQPGWGTTWHKIRVYTKVPSSSSASDGMTKVWIDDKLIYTLSNIKGKSGWYNYTTNISFHPSDDFFQGIGGNKFPFNHFYDDITVYEGYVPPQTGAPIQTVSAPTGLKILN